MNATSVKDRLKKYALETGKTFVYPIMQGETKIKWNPEKREWE